MKKVRKKERKLCFESRKVRKKERKFCFESRKVRKKERKFCFESRKAKKQSFSLRDRRTDVVKDTFFILSDHCKKKKTFFHKKAKKENF